MSTHCYSLVVCGRVLIDDELKNYTYVDLVDTLQVKTLDGVLPVIVPTLWNVDESESGSELHLRFEVRRTDDGTVVESKEAKATFNGFGKGFLRLKGLRVGGQDGALSVHVAWRRSENDDWQFSAAYWRIRVEVVSGDNPPAQATQLPEDG